MLRTRDSRTCLVGPSIPIFFLFHAPAHPSATEGECIWSCFQQILDSETQILASGTQILDKILG